MKKVIKCRSCCGRTEPARFPVLSIAPALILTLFLGACAPKDTALFATTTSLGLDVDQTSPVASLGFHRAEGYIGPRHDDGTIPPVFASISAKSGLFSSKVKQL